MEKIKFNIGSLPIGGNEEISIQSMSDLQTKDTENNIALTNRLTPLGLGMMRFSVLDKEDAKALATIKKNVSIPVIADIHFSPILAFLALESGVDKIRINPGNFQSESQLRTLIKEAKEKDIAIRIGVNAGSLNRYRGKTKSREEDILLALDETLSVFQEEKFEKLVLSLKSSDPILTQRLYRLADKRYPYPLHIGLTESGTPLLGSIRSTYALSSLLQDGIGNTLRISLPGDRRDEIRAAKELLRLTGRRNDIPTLIVCPGCGRTLIDLKSVASEVENLLDTIRKNIKVAVMGCPVNGIGEAKDADCGIAGSGKKDVYLYFVHGKEKGLYTKEEALDKISEFIRNFVL